MRQKIRLSLFVAMFGLLLSPQRADSRQESPSSDEVSKAYVNRAGNFIYVEALGEWMRGDPVRDRNVTAHRKAFGLESYDRAALDQERSGLTAEQAAAAADLLETIVQRSKENQGLPNDRLIQMTQSGYEREIVALRSVAAARPNDEADPAKPDTQPLTADELIESISDIVDGVNAVSENMIEALNMLPLLPDYDTAEGYGTDQDIQFMTDVVFELALEAIGIRAFDALSDVVPRFPIWDDLKNYFDEVRHSEAGAVNPGRPRPKAQGGVKPRTPEQEVLISELGEAGIKHNVDDIIHIGKNPEGDIVFLETGNSGAGLEHIIAEHGDDFLNNGVPQDKIADVVFNAIVSGNLAGTAGGRPVYQIVHNGKPLTIQVTLASNGFIVGANPIRPSSIKPMP